MLVPCTRKACATKVIRKKQNSTATERSWRNSQHRAQDALARRRARGRGATALAGGRERQLRAALAGPELRRARGSRAAPLHDPGAARSGRAARVPPKATIRKPMPRLAAESR